MELRKLVLQYCKVISLQLIKINGKKIIKKKKKKEKRKMVTMTLYVRQQKRHRCKEQTFGLSGRRRGWDDL